MRHVVVTLMVLGFVATGAAKVVTEAVPYRDDDVALEGYLAYDDAQAGPRPAVLVVHEWWGLNEFAKEQARRLAELGYVAFAVDMYGKGSVTEDAQQAGQWARALYSDAQKWRQRARAGLEAVAGHERVDRSRIAAIGYCFGGATVQQMALAGLPLKGVVSFHGSLVPPSEEDARRTRARVLILHGATDTLIADEDFQKYLKAMRGTELDWQLVVYSGAKHSFTNPKADRAGMEGVGYHAPTAKRSWGQMRLFLGEVFDETVTLGADQR